MRDKLSELNFAVKALEKEKTNTGRNRDRKTQDCRNYFSSKKEEEHNHLTPYDSLSKQPLRNSAGFSKIEFVMKECSILRKAIRKMADVVADEIEDIK